MVDVTDHPTINPRRSILPIPALGRVVGFEDHLPPAVVDYHAELTNQIACSNRPEGVVQAVVVGGEGVGNIKVEGHINILQVSGINGGAAFLGLNNN